jgi:hypothetical protein
MIASGTNSPTNFQRYQFQLAHTFLHEIGGHLLVTYLSGGTQITPPIMAHPFHGPNGEAGRYLEETLFGGTVEFYRIKNQGNPQVRELFSFRISSYYLSLASRIF